MSFSSKAVDYTTIATPRYDEQLRKYSKIRFRETVPTVQFFAAVIPKMWGKKLSLRKKKICPKRRLQFYWKKICRRCLSLKFTTIRRAAIASNNWELLFLFLLIFAEILHYYTAQKKWSFLFRISSVNVTKSAGNFGFGHICWRNL